MEEVLVKTPAPVEAGGLRPRLVRGDPRNLKVTWPADVALAEGFLQHFPDMR